MKKTLADALNRQATMEMEAAIVYEQLAIDMEALDLSGIASWFRAQAAEERVHCEKFVNHLLDRGEHPHFLAMNIGETKANTVLEAFQASLAHEEKVSESIRALYRLALEEGEIDSLPLLSWFIDEQVEEEATVSGIIGRVKLIANDGVGLLAMDRELGTRQINEER